MVFSSVTFLFLFLPVTLIIYFFSPPKLKNIVLLLASLVFYFYSEPRFFFIFIMSIIFNYCFGLIINNCKRQVFRKTAFITAVTGNLLLILLFKYADFAIKNINLASSNNIPLLKLILPIGISFYTFQALSYLTDLYRQEIPPQRDFIKLSLYISLFPQLIAGPVVRYQTINNELMERKQNYKDFSYGVRRFVTGLFKKLVIADQISVLWNLSYQTGQPSILLYWMGAIGFTLQIYYDFSAYSDMAIGLGSMFGFHFKENFDHPYASKNITEFWRKWHISLGSWFRDYLYIPLGGNRKGKLRWIINILIVWILTGLWHGAEWNFVLWGLGFGVILMIEKLFLLNILKKTPLIISNIYTKVIIIISFVVFNSTVTDAVIYIKGMLGVSKYPFYNTFSLYYLKSYLPLIVTAVLLSGNIPVKIMNWIKENPKIYKIILKTEPLMLLLIFLTALGFLVDSSYQPFLYFRF